MDTELKIFILCMIAAFWVTVFGGMTVKNDTAQLVAKAALLVILGIATTALGHWIIGYE